MNRVKALLSLAILIAGGWAGYKILPPYFANYQFQDALDTEVKFGAYSERSENEIRDKVLKKAKEYELPLRAEQIRVQRIGNAVSISADYKVHVDLPFYPLDLQFHPASKDATKF